MMKKMWRIRSAGRAFQSVFHLNYSLKSNLTIILNSGLPRQRNTWVSRWQNDTVVSGEFSACSLKTTSNIFVAEDVYSDFQMAFSSMAWAYVCVCVYQSKFIAQAMEEKCHKLGIQIDKTHTNMRWLDRLKRGLFNAWNV